jgi:alpha-tubulin suppressor-like RCC1 family protein
LFLGLGATDFLASMKNQSSCRVRVVVRVRRVFRDRVTPVRWLLLAALFSGCAEPFIPRSGVPTLDDGSPVSDGFVTVSAGREHTCALKSDGAAYCWGSNEFGQLGAPEDGTTCSREDRPIACRLTPTSVQGNLKFTRISAGGAHTCAIATDGRVYCWGDNLRGALGDPGVRLMTAPNPVVSADAFVDLAAGGSHSCALRTDGVLMCWGANNDGQLGFSTVGNGSAIPLAVQTSQRFASVAAGSRRTCARVPDGTAFCWGATWVTRQDGIEVTRSQGNPFRTLQAPSFSMLAVGTNTTCGVAVDNQAYCWEANPAGGIGDGTNAGSTSPKAVAGGIDFVAISAGATHTCGIADTGLAYCWGDNTRGQLGVSPALIGGRCGGAAVPCNRAPLQVSGWRIFSMITAGQGDHSCALTLTGNIYCWGAGGLGQRGDGRTTNEWSPAKTRSP